MTQKIFEFLKRVTTLPNVNTTWEKPNISINGLAIRYNDIPGLIFYFKVHDDLEQLFEQVRDYVPSNYPTNQTLVNFGSPTSFLPTE